MIKTLNLTSEIFTRVVEDVITREELEYRLKGKKQLRIKLGIDATASDLHIGHGVNLWKIRALQEMGHKAVIVLGDFTTQIGDPTGKSQTRPMLTPAAIKKNITAIKRQIENILLTSSRVYELRHNTEWFRNMKAGALLNLLRMVTHAQLIERDMFQERIKEGSEIRMSELLYPILQGYDSVMVKSDLTIIGSDQLFNEHMGRFFQQRFGQQPQVIITHKLVPGLSGGEKMSKSLGNYVGLNDSPKDKFGKIMRVLDNLIVSYLEAYTDMPMSDIRRIEKDMAGGANPMEAKLILAEALVCRYHGAVSARYEKEQFIKVFSLGEKPDAITEIMLKKGTWQIIDLLIALGGASSKSEARRLIDQGGVEIDGIRIRMDMRNVIIKEASIVRIGKRRFFKII